MHHVAANLLAHHFAPGNSQAPGSSALAGSSPLASPGPGPGACAVMAESQLFLQVTHITDIRAHEIWVLAVMVASSLSLYLLSAVFNMAPREFRLLVFVCRRCLGIAFAPSGSSLRRHSHEHLFHWLHPAPNTHSRVNVCKSQGSWSRKRRISTVAQS